MKNLEQNPQYDKLVAMIHEDMAKNPINYNFGSNNNFIYDEVDERTDEQIVISNLNEAIKIVGNSFYMSQIKKDHKNLSAIELQEFVDMFMQGKLENVFNTLNSPQYYINFIITAVKRYKYTTKDEFHVEKTCKQYIVEKLNLDKTKLRDFMIIRLVEKICKCYALKTKSEKKSDIPISFLKKQLLDESPKFIEDYFSRIPVFHLIVWLPYEFGDAKQSEEILTLVKLVVKNGNTLQDIPNLTPESDWKKQIYYFYNIPLEKPKKEKLSEEERKKRIIEGGRKGGKAHKTNRTKTITIQNILTNEVHTFDMYSKCMKFLKIRSKATFSSFIKGNTKTNKRWKIVENQSI